MTKPKHSAENERIKRRYFQWMRETRGYSPPSIDIAAAAIFRFEEYVGFRDFKRFNVEQARAFKSHLAGKTLGVQSGAPLSKATITTTLRNLKSFFMWLSDQPGYRSRIRPTDAAYFTPLAQDERIASGARFKPVPELHEIEAALRAMPDETAIERRDRAVVAFILLTGARDRAVTTFKLKHVDLARGTLFQDARDVKTKRAKTFVTQFFPVGDLPRDIVTRWVTFLRTSKGFGPDDPLFPATEVALHGPGAAPSVALARRTWKTTAPVRDIFKAAFERAGLPYFNPHSFRSTLARLGQQLCKTPEELKAWSQNLGHSNVMTTFTSYGTLDAHQQCKIIDAIGNRSSDVHHDALAAELAEFLKTRKGQGNINEEGDAVKRL
jgi:integrase